MVRDDRLPIHPDVVSILRSPGEGRPLRVGRDAEGRDVLETEDGSCAYLIRDGVVEFLDDSDRDDAPEG